MYDELITTLRDAGVYTALQRGGRLACSRSGGDWGIGGGLWVANRAATWFVSTWTPRVYISPACSEPHEIAQCIVEALDSAPEPFYDFSSLVKTKYGLREVTLEEMDSAANK